MLLEELSFVERYAWFASDATSPQLGPSALFNPDQTLTPLGRFYSTHQAAKLRTKTKRSRVLANEFESGRRI